MSDIETKATKLQEKLSLREMLSALGILDGREWIFVTGMDNFVTIAKDMLDRVEVLEDECI